MLPNLQSLPVGVQGNTRRPVEEVVYDYHNPPVDVDIVGPLGWRFGGFSGVLSANNTVLSADLDLVFIFHLQGDSRRHVLRNAAYMYVSFSSDDSQRVNYSHDFGQFHNLGACSRAAWRVRDSAYAVAAAAYNRSRFARQTNREMVREYEGRWVTRSKAEPVLAS